jgi:hypothetical protein
MGKLIIDTQTGTILNIEHCYIIEDTDLKEEYELTCDELQEVADRSGIYINKMGNDTGWGDNTYRYTVSYSPKSIKDEADSILEGGIYEEGDREYEALVWAKDADLNDLTDISDSIMSQDGVWNGFRENLTEMLVFIHALKKEQK